MALLIFEIANPHGVCNVRVTHYHLNNKVCVRTSISGFEVCSLFPSAIGSRSRYRVCFVVRNDGKKNVISHFYG